jgi:hypothetical protein
LVQSLRGKKISVVPGGLAVTRRTWLEASGELLFGPVVQFVLLVCAVLPSLIMATFLTIYSIVMRTASVIIGRIVLSVAKLLGRLALPVLVCKAVFGQDRGRFLEVKDLPPDVGHREDISERLHNDAANASQRLSRDIGQALLHAVAKGDAFAIKAQVTHALTDTKLAHSYYYKAPEIRERIAQLIAKPPPQSRESLPWFDWERWLNTTNSQ